MNIETDFRQIWYATHPNDATNQNLMNGFNKRVYGYEAVIK